MKVHQSHYMVTQLIFKAELLVKCSNLGHGRNILGLMAPSESENNLQNYVRERKQMTRSGQKSFLLQNIFI